MRNQRYPRHVACRVLCNNHVEIRGEFNILKKKVVYMSFVVVPIKNSAPIFASSWRWVRVLL